MTPPGVHYQTSVYITLLAEQYRDGMHCSRAVFTKWLLPFFGSELIGGDDADSKALPDSWKYQD